jgi:antitoxin component of RelBE/YafQ-DinJ toxin-antitoxin module
MVKQTLNLTIKENIKERAKRIAKSRGISVSRLFEEAIAREEDPEELHLDPDSAAYKIYHMIPESEKVDDYDYKEMKENILKEKYGV